ncbi:hypothetical protein SRHO_G00302550 [Serrasalmus rhombeus]
MRALSLAEEWRPNRPCGPTLASRPPFEQSCSKEKETLPYMDGPSSKQPAPRAAVVLRPVLMAPSHICLNLSGRLAEEIFV